MRTTTTTEHAFQFHTGSIRSCPCSHICLNCCAVSIPHWFDQKFRLNCTHGLLSCVSIPHWFDQKKYRRCHHNWQCIRFNSTLVRLEESGKTPRTNSIYCFNSTLVRLEAFEAKFREGLSEWFQFHTGSIRSQFRNMKAVASNPRFNSTLVRLEDSPVTVARRRFYSFNSTLVRLEAGVFRRCASSVFSVSIPHWFDQKRCGKTRSCWALSFQFHTGSIRSRISAFVFKPLSVFQFHTGSIRSNLETARVKRRRHVSIPHWFDQKEKLGDCHVSIKEFQFHTGSIRSWRVSSGNLTLQVSIPHWFDQKTPRIRQIH